MTDIALLEAYNEWVIDQKLNPPRYTPGEYAEHLRHLRNEQIIENALEMIGKYHKGIDWTPEMIEALLGILRDEK